MARTRTTTARVRGVRRVGVSGRRESPTERNSRNRSLLSVPEKIWANRIARPPPGHIGGDAFGLWRSARRIRASAMRTFKLFFLATTSRKCVLLSNRPHATRYRPVDTSAPFGPSSVVSQNAMTPGRHRPSPVAISTSRPISGSSLSSYERGDMTARSRPSLGARRAMPSRAIFVETFGRPDDRLARDRAITFFGAGSWARPRTRWWTRRSRSTQTYTRATSGVCSRSARPSMTSGGTACRASRRRSGSSRITTATARCARWRSPRAGTSFSGVSSSASSRR